ncbi:hypothetical protein A2U01_0090642, partial [Trifolium medium]|nr:hypothetical protein [Trifolium medium]
MEGIPEDAMLKELLSKRGVEDLELWNKVKKAWGQANKKVMGKKNC